MTTPSAALRTLVATSVIGLALLASACGSSGSKDASASRSVPPPPTSPATSAAATATAGTTSSASSAATTADPGATGTDGSASWPGGASGDTATGTEAPADNDLYVVTIDVTGLTAYDATEREKLVGNRAKEDGLEVVDWHLENGKIVVAGGADAVAKVREEKYVTSVDLFKD